VPLYIRVSVWHRTRQCESHKRNLDDITGTGTRNWKFFSGRRTCSRAGTARKHRQWGRKVTTLDKKQEARKPCFGAIGSSYNSVMFSVRAEFGLRDGFETHNLSVHRKMLSVIIAWTTDDDRFDRRQRTRRQRRPITAFDGRRYLCNKAFG